MLDNISLYFPNLELVIDRSVSIVAPHTPLIEVISLMGKNRALCSIENVDLVFSKLHEVSEDCILISENNNQLLGIFTERDVVKLSAAGVDFMSCTVEQVMKKPVITLKKSDFKNLFSALSLMRQHHIRHLPILGDCGEVVGVVTSSSIRKTLQPLNLLKVRTVAEVMQKNVFTATPTTSLLKLAEIMSKHEISCVVICQNQPDSLLKIPLGIVTERDIVQFQTLDLDLAQTYAETVMSSPLFSLNPEDSLWNAHQIMLQRSIRRLVVTGSQGEMIGIVTQTTILKAFDPMEMYRVIDILQKSVEERTVELTQTNQQLQQEILERQQIENELRKALEKEKELNDLKSRFTAMVTHEFRNPLTAILCLAQLVEQFFDQLERDKINSHLQRIQETAKYMNQLIEDLLIIGSAESKKIPLNPTFLKLNEFCHNLVESYQLHNFNQQNIQLHFQGVCPEEVYLDEKVLRHILENLLSNACKYSPDRSSINFGVKFDQNQVIFQVQDQGIGIPLEDQIRLFESFHRGKNVGNIQGTGLGLAIVKRCVDLLGGKIDFQSEVGKGTTFTVLIPYQQELKNF